MLNCTRVFLFFLENVIAIYVVVCTDFYAYFTLRIYSIWSESYFKTFGLKYSILPLQVTQILSCTLIQFQTQLISRKPTATPLLNLNNRL